MVVEYSVMGNGRVTLNERSSADPLIPPVQMEVRFVNCTTGTLLQTPAEQLVLGAEQVLPTAPQLLSSSKVLTQYPDDPNAYGKMQLTKEFIPNYHRIPLR